MKSVYVFAIVLLVACTPSEKENWDGAWQAQWFTDRNAPGYEGIPTDYVFEMDGQFQFENETVTISAYGFPKCIFQSDTSIHSQKWSLSNDTLQLVSQNGELSLQYLVLEQTDKKIRLQLLDDIYITLTK